VILLFITGCGTIVLGILFLGGIRQPAEFMNAWWGKNVFEYMDRLIGI